MITASDYIARLEGKNRPAAGSRAEEYARRYSKTHADTLNTKQIEYAKELGVTPSSLPTTKEYTAPTVMGAYTYNAETADNDINLRETNLKAWEEYLKGVSDNITAAERKLAWTGSSDDYNAYKNQVDLYNKGLESAKNEQGFYDQARQIYMDQYKAAHPEYETNLRRAEMLESVGYWDDNDNYILSADVGTVIKKAKQAKDATEGQLWLDVISNYSQPKSVEEQQEVNALIDQQIDRLKAEGMENGWVNAGEEGMIQDVVYKRSEDIAKLEQLRAQMNSGAQRERYKNAYADAMDALPEELRKEIMKLPEELVYTEIYSKSGQGEEQSMKALAHEESVRLRLRDMGYSTEQISGMIGYAKQIHNEITAESDAATAARNAQEASSFGNWFKNVGLGLMQSMELPQLTLQTMTAKTDPFTGEKTPVDYNAAKIYNMNQAVMSGQQQKVMDKYLAEFDDEEQARKKANFAMNAYQLAVSMGESAANMLLAGAGLPMSSLILGSSAGVSTLMDYKQQGYSDGEALAMGMVSAAAEYFTEKYSVEAFFKMKDIAGKTGLEAINIALGNTLRQFLSEGSEEFASDMLNTLGDAVVMGFAGKENKLQQEFELTRAENISKGMTTQEAEKSAAKAVFWNNIYSALQSFVMGGISGGLFGILGSAISGVSGAVSDYGTGKAIQKGDMTSFRKLVNDMGLTLSEDAGKLETGRAMRSIETKATDDAIVKRLTELGEKLNPATQQRLVKAIKAEATGQRINQQEKNALKVSKFGDQVISEFTDMVNGVMTEENRWAVGNQIANELTRQVATAEEQPEIRNNFEEGYTAPAKTDARMNAEIQENLTEYGNTENLTEEQLDAYNAGKEAERARQQTQEQEQTQKRAGEDYESYVRGLMKEMIYSKAKEIKKDPNLRAAFENITGQTLTGNTKAQTRQIMDESSRLTNAEEYVRGLMRDMDAEAAQEIYDNPQYRAIWERLTGEKAQSARDIQRAEMEADTTEIVWWEEDELPYNGKLNNLRDSLETQNIVDIDTEDGNIRASVGQSKNGWIGYASLDHGNALTSEGRTRTEAIENLIKEIEDYAEERRSQSAGDGGQRTGRVDSGEQAGRLDEEAGRDQAGNGSGRGDTRNAGGEGAARQNGSSPRGITSRTAAEAGINGGDSSRRELKPFTWGESEEVDTFIRENPELMYIVDNASSRGETVHFYTGNLRMAQGIVVRGLNNGRGDIWIKTNDKGWTPTQIWEHETGHDSVRKNGITDEMVVAATDGMSVLEYRKMLSEYRNDLQDSETMTDDDILEEILCDAKAGKGVLVGRQDGVSRAMAGEALPTEMPVEDKGIKFSFGGRNSKTANIELNRLAQSMENEGYSPENIRRETGWFRGADGEWRYEIDDSRARLNLNGDARFRQQHPGYARYMQLLDNMLYGELTGEEMRELRELDREWSEETQTLRTAVENGTVRLADIMKHDGLYEAYPDIAEIDISFESMNGARGAYIPSKKKIVLNEELRKDHDALMNTLLHEVQHAIQLEEGFAGGASPEYWNRQETYERAMEKYRDEHGKIFYNLSKEDRALYREYMEITDREGKLLEIPTVENLEELYALEERSDELYRELYGKEWFGKLNRLDRIMDDVKQAVMTMYWSTAGEIEARDTSNRRSMSDEQRKNSPPDTGDELTVFAEDGTRSNMVAEKASAMGVDEDIPLSIAGSANGELRTGSPFSAELFHGKGKSREEIYTNHQIPVAGEGTYYAFTEDGAKSYGDSVTSTRVELRNPLVIRDDGEWKVLTVQAGQRFANPTYLSGAEAEAFTKAIRETVLAQGHDGLIIRYELDSDGDMNTRTGGWKKTLDDVFGGDQVVVYQQSESATQATRQQTAAAEEEDTNPIDRKQTESFNPWTTEGMPEFYPGTNIPLSDIMNAKSDDALRAAGINPDMIVETENGFYRAGDLGLQPFEFPLAQRTENAPSQDGNKIDLLYDEKPITKMEAKTIADGARYPMLHRLDGKADEQALPWYSWVLCTDRMNYGLVTGFDPNRGVQVRIYNKSSGFGTEKFLNEKELRIVDPKYSGNFYGEFNEQDIPPVVEGPYDNLSDQELDEIMREAEDMLEGRNRTAEQIVAQGELNTEEESPQKLVREALEDEPDLMSVDLAGSPEQYEFILRATRGKGGNYNKTIDQNMDDAFERKEDRALAEKYIIKPINDARGDYAREISTRKADLARKMKALGIKQDSAENRAIVWYGEGIKQGEGSGLPAEVQQEYTLEDLKAEFPQSWQRIKEASEYMRKMYDDMLEEQNASRSRVYPNVVEKAEAKIKQLDITRKTMEERSSEQVRLFSQIRDDINRTQATLDRTQDSSVRAELQSRLIDLNRIAENVRARSDYYDVQAARAKSVAAKLRADIESGKIIRNKYIWPRKDYFHHGREMATGMEGLINTLKSDANIDSALAGLSEFTKPKAKWQGHFQHRSDAIYNADAIGDMLSYIDAAAYVTHIDPVTARLRQQVSYMAQLTEKTRNANRMLTWMTDYINQLAGKTNPMDRFLTTKLMGRKALKVMKWINGRVKANAVGANVKSAVAQFFNLQNCAMLIKNPTDWVAGTESMIQWMTGDESARTVMDSSDFLMSRYGIGAAENMFETSKLRKASDYIMQFGDEAVARLAWWSAYEKALKENNENPIYYADDIVRRAVAGRGVGEVPLVQDAEITKLFAPFQVEVNNTFQLVKSKVKDKDWGALALFALVSYLMNEPLREYFGFDVSWDPINAVVEAVQNVDEDDNAFQKTMKIGGRLAGEVFSNAAYGSQAAQLLISDDDSREALFGDTDPTRFGTGQIGINAMVDPIVDLITGDEASEDLLEAVINIALPYGGKQTTRIIDTLQTYGVLPEVSISTTDGVSAYRQKGGGAVYSAGGNLKYTPDSTWGNWVKSLMFGNYATEEGKEYLENGSVMSSAMTEDFRRLTEQGVSTKRAAEIVKGLNELTKTKEGQTKQKGQTYTDAITYLAGSGLTQEQQQELFYNRIASDSRKIDIDALSEAGMDWRDISDALTTYYALDRNEALSANQKATQLAAWAMDNLTLSQSQTVRQTLTYSSGFTASTNTYDSYVSAGLDPVKASEVVMRFGQITPEAGRDSATEEQKLYSLSTANFLSDEERYQVAGAMSGMELETESGNPSQYAKMLAMKRAGLSFDDYISIKTANKTADKARALRSAELADQDKLAVADTFITDNQSWYLGQIGQYGVSFDVWADFIQILPMFDENGNGSYTQAEVTAALKAMKLDDEQKAALWQMQCGGKKNPFDSQIGTKIYNAFKSK